jgi:tRNA pseudouridine38-40 synthase
MKLLIEYDGTDYVGWQAQTNGRSVQASLERSLRELLDEEVKVSSAARTDAGVHALGQVVCFDTTRVLPAKAYWSGLTQLLPRDISVLEATEVEAGFDPRRASSGKRYRYLLSNRPRRSPLRRRTHWEVFQPLEASAMAAAAPALLGLHDFSAFRASDCQAHHATRKLTRVEVEAKGDEVLFHVEGTAFLKHMVRNIVGSLVEVGKGKQPPQWIAEVLASKDRKLAGPTAPAHGLTLVEVLYGAREALDEESDE